MSNELRRIEAVYVVPGQPPRAGQPAYSYQRETLVDPGGPPPPGYSWTYIQNSGSQGAGSSVSDGFESVLIEGDSGSNGTPFYAIETVHVPAVPAYAGTPDQSYSLPAPGWSAFARSVDSFIANGKVEFQVDADVEAAVLGLTTYSGIPESGYGHITHGLLFTGQEVISLVTGISLDSYTSSDVFRIEVVDGTVRFFKGGTVIDSMVATISASDPIYLAAALHLAGDFAFNPSIVQYGVRSSGEFTAEMYATDHLAAAGSMTIGIGLEGRTALYNTMSMVAYLQGFDHTAAAGRMSFSFALSGSTSLPIVHKLKPSMSMLMAMSGNTVRAPIAEAAMAIPAARMFSTDMAGAVGYMEIAAPRMSAFAQRYFRTVPWHLSKSSATFEPRLLLTTVVHHGVVVGATFASSMVVRELIEELLSGQVSNTALLSLRELLAEAMLVGKAAPSLLDPTDTQSIDPESGATTTYESYGFNSYASVAGEHYGASKHGLFWLGGSTDDGALINYVVSLGKPNFGSGQNNRITDVYVGVTSQSEMLLRLTTEGSSYTYKIRNYDQHMQQQRFQVGRGLRGNHIEIELLGTGGDWELETIDFRLVRSERRL